MARKRDRSFEILVKEHERALRAFVRGCSYDKAAADDVVQETFVIAWRKLKQYDERIPFARWLRGIAINQVHAHDRKEAIRSKHIRFLTREQIGAVADEFDRLVPGRGDVSTDTLEALRACLDALPANDREVVRRVYEGGQACKIVADELGSTAIAIRQRLRRARLRLRDCILGKLRMEITHA